MKIERFSFFELGVDPDELLDLVTQFVKEYKEEHEKRMFCMDCGVDTRIHPLDDYMVHDVLWLSVVPQDKGMLCIACLSGRLGRALTDDDFTDYPVNDIRKIYESSEANDKAMPCVQDGQGNDWYECIP